MFRPCRIPLLLATLEVLAAQESGERPLLRTAAEVRALGLETAAARHDVRIEGVVTFSWNTATSEITVQDATGAVLLPAIPLPPGCQAGARVVVEGRTEAGAFGPIVQPEIVRVTGQASLPAPVPATYENLLTPALHGRRVVVEGIVRSQRANPEVGLDWLALDLVVGGGRVMVNVTHEIAGHPELIDARVRVCGVSLHGPDARQSSFLPVVQARSLENIRVVTPAPQHPYAVPPVPLDRLLRGPGGGHRARMRGTVTLARPGGSFFLQDGTRGLEVFVREPPVPLPGECVDVVGFPEPGAFSPVVRDAEWRPSHPVPPPEPLWVNAAEAPRHDGRLATLTGRLLEILPTASGAILEMESERVRFRANLQHAAARPPGAGSLLELTGVCMVQDGDWESMVSGTGPKKFVLVLRNMDDIKVLRAAPFWTPGRAAWGLAAAGACVAAMLAVLWQRSRRRLHETARAREAAGSLFAAVLAERERMAREIHDTLAQGFAGISAQLEALRQRLGTLPDPARRHLDLARDLVRDSLAEARRSVWNLRPQALEQHGLEEAIGRLGRQLTEGTACAFSLHTEGCPRPLPAEVESNVLRICQEALTNAIRHSGATELKVRMIFSTHSFRLEVADNGRGFDTAQAGRETAGGFGLLGLRERAEAIHATLRIGGGPAAGTKIELDLDDV